jgi:hypothetical protein
MDTSKLVAGQGPQQRSRLDSQPADDVARRFQEMVAPRAERESTAPPAPPRAEAREAASEEVLELTPETLVNVAAPPAREDEADVLDDEPRPDPQPATQANSAPVDPARGTSSPAPATPSPAPAGSIVATGSSTAQTPAAPQGSGASPWQALSPSAIEAARGHDPAPSLRDKAVPPPPVLTAPAEPEAPDLQGQGVRAWLASKTSNEAATPDALPTTPSSSLPVGLAGAPAVRWADLLRRGASRAQGAGTSETSPVSGAGGSNSTTDLHAQLMDIIAGKDPAGTPTATQEAPEAPAAETQPTAPLQEDTLQQIVDRAVAAAREPATQPATSAARAATTARPGAPAQPSFFAPAPEQAPGAMRIRVPTANGETVRGNLHVDPDTRAVRLTLAVQEGQTARSMSTAHEMLRARLADEGYQLSSYVVRHDGKSILRLDSGQLGEDARSAAGFAEGHASDENSQRSSDERTHEPLAPPEVPELSEDPVVAGWFV